MVTSEELAEMIEIDAVLLKADEAFGEAEDTFELAKAVHQEAMDTFIEDMNHYPNHFVYLTHSEHDRRSSIRKQRELLEELKKQFPTSPCSSAVTVETDPRLTLLNAIKVNYRRIASGHPPLECTDELLIREQKEIYLSDRGWKLAGTSGPSYWIHPNGRETFSLEGACEEQFALDSLPLVSCEGS